MAMPLPLPIYTVDMVRAFPDDGQRYELVEGMLLVTPAPGSAHQVVVSRLLTGLSNYLGANGPAYVVSPGEIEIPPTTLHCEPDILVFPATFRPGTTWTKIRDWWLAVEVLSPSSKYYDRDYKLEAYLRVGVREVWIVDLAARRVEVSDATGRRGVAEESAVLWRPREMAAPLVLKLDAIFREIV
jgi:Uma2 family endonuclease